MNEFLKIYLQKIIKNKKIFNDILDVLMSQQLRPTANPLKSQDALILPNLILWFFVDLKEKETQTTINSQRWPNLNGISRRNEQINMTNALISSSDKSTSN